MGAFGTLGGTAYPSGYYGLAHNFNVGWNQTNGLLGLGARLYDLQTGRFINRDPMGYGGGMNLYGYADDDPVDGFDPTGTETFSQWYYGGMGGASEALDNSPFFGGATAALGQAAGDYDSGCGSAAAVAEAGANWLADAAGVALMFVGDEAGPGCFVAGTPVQMADGSTKPIEKIKIGDAVVSRNATTGKTEPKRVVSTIVHYHISTIALTFANGEHIVTTAPHPFYVNGKGFVPAGRLAVGNAIVTRAGPTVTITRIERTPAATVYNLTVDGYHTYFVGTKDGGVWVHNAPCIQRHHIFPQQFKRFFQRIGINIHDWTVELGVGEHLSGVHGVGGYPFPNGYPGTTPGRYNALWDAWIQAHPNANASEAYAFARQMMRRFGLDGLPIVPYR